MDVLMLPVFSEAALIFMQTQGHCLGDMMGSFPTGPQWSPISKGEKAFKCVFADPPLPSEGIQTLAGDGERETTKTSENLKIRAILVLTS